MARPLRSQFQIKSRPEPSTTAMIAWYAQIKWLHIVAVLLSGSLFVARGGLVHWHRRLAMHAAVRYLSYAIDTVLLTAAMLLLAMLPAALFANGWLWCKLALLPIYIVLGVFALKPTQSRRRSWLFFIAAIGVFVFMLGVARMHHPLGWLQLLLAK
jgi:uncharacterized membrane protein SirB2